MYCDGGQFAQETQSGAGATTDILLSAGVQVRVNGAKDLMHLKSYAIDGRLLRTGFATDLPGVSSARTTMCSTNRSRSRGTVRADFGEMWGKASNTTAKSRTLKC